MNVGCPDKIVTTASILRDVLEVKLGSSAQGGGFQNIPVAENVIPMQFDTLVLEASATDDNSEKSLIVCEVKLENIV